MTELSDQEMAKIVQFNQDPILVEAVRKVMLKAMYSQGTLRKNVPADPLNNGALNLAFQALRGGSLSDADLGADIRGLANGINLLESAFQELERIEVVIPKKEEETNPGI